jgi:hypothetical protein
MYVKNRFIVAFVAILFPLLQCCGYTVLRNLPAEEARQRALTGMLPDLAITGITTSIEYPQIIMDNPTVYPSMLVFHVQIRNIGGAPLDGSIMITYAVNENDIANSVFPLSGDVHSGDLAVGGQYHGNGHEPCRMVSAWNQGSILPARG